MIFFPYEKLIKIESLCWKIRQIVHFGTSFGKAQLLIGVKLANQNKNKMARKFKWDFFAMIFNTVLIGLNEKWWNFFITSYFLGKPIAGTGAGLRPIGQDPNFAQDLREIFNISYPIRSPAEEDLMLSRDNYCGNGRNKWPKPELVSEDWKATVSNFLELPTNSIFFFCWDFSFSWCCTQSSVTII